MIDLLVGGARSRVVTMSEVSLSCAFISSPLMAFTSSTISFLFLFALFRPCTTQSNYCIGNSKAAVLWRAGATRSCLFWLESEQWKKDAAPAPALTCSQYLSRHLILVDIIFANQSETKFTKILSNLSFREIKPIKGIVSRDWGGLQMILLDRLEVFNISASCFF